MSRDSRPTLTDEQERAVSRRGEPLLLAAGAGSGKTTVLVERFVRAVLEDGLAPGKVLAITFTDRAAGELRERVRRRLLELGEREAARDTEAAFVGTFHAFCARLLRVHPLLAGLDPDFSVLDEGAARRLRESAFAAAVVDFQDAGGEAAVDLLAAYTVDQVREMVLGVHAELRSRGMRRPRLPALRGGEPHTPEDARAVAACELLDGLLSGFGERYETLKASRAAADFDDLELIAVELLRERPRVRAAWAERFGLLMVDEFQDTNPRQLAILQALDRGNLFTVGDELQSIYGFRHADVELFRARRAQLAPHGGSLELTGNFRSRPALLDVVNSVFAGRIGDRYTSLQARRGVSDRAAGGEVELLLTARNGWEVDDELRARLGAGLPGAPAWRQAEARLLAQRVGELVLAGEARAGEVAVLLRASGDIDLFERALQLRGLHTLAAVGGFWGRLQVRDLLVYLRALANPLDEQALYQVLGSPIVGLSSDGLALLAAAVRAGRGGAWETACALERSDPGGAGELLARLGREDRDRLARFCARLRGERRQLRERTLSQLIERVLDDGYVEHVLAAEWAERRMANVHKLLRLARRFEASEGRDLRGFLDHAERLDAARRPEPEAPVDSVEPDAVRLMTIHAAKGLEFAVVCVADLGRAPNTRMPRLLVDGPRVGLQLLGLDGARSRPTLDYEELCQEHRRAQAEEEDRILYVAMTRARERLLLSGAIDFDAEQAETTAIGWLAPALTGAMAGALDAAPPLFDVAVAGRCGPALVGCRLNRPATVGEVMELAGERERPAPTEASLPEAPSPPAPASWGDAASATPGEAPARGGPLAPVGAPAAPELPGLSYTALVELERCGYRYYLERVLGFGEERGAAAGPREAGLDPRARGTLVHRLLERADVGSGPPPVQDTVTRVAAELGIRLRGDSRQDVIELLARAWSSPVAARVAAARRIGREHPFAFSLGPDQPLVTGVIDLLAREGDGTMLVLDYKSDRLAADADLEGVVERDYGIQRLIYAVAVLRDGAPAVEVAHWFLERPRQWVSARYAAAERSVLEERLARRMRLALAGGFAVSASPHRELCLTCPGRLALCSWGPEETARETPGAALRLPLGAVGGDAREDRPRDAGEPAPQPSG